MDVEKILVIQRSTCSVENRHEIFFFFILMSEMCPVCICVCVSAAGHAGTTRANGFDWKIRASGQFVISIKFLFPWLFHIIHENVFSFLNPC